MRSVLKNKVLVTVIAILLLANIAMLVFFISGMKKPDSEHRPEQKEASRTTESFLQNRIGFTDEQVLQFNKLRDEHHQKLFPLFEDVRKTKDQFYLMVKNAPSDSYLDSLAARIGEKQRILDREVFQTILQVRSLCTQQQQSTFDSLLPKIAYKMAGHIRRGNPKEDSLKRPH